MMTTDTAHMHPAEAYLRDEKNPRWLAIQYHGHRRRLLLCKNSNCVLLMNPRTRTWGKLFYDWKNIEKIFYPVQHSVESDLFKYQKLAAKATFTNDWLRNILKADPKRSLYENGITTGTGLDGKCVRISTIAKYCGPEVMEAFRHALARKEEYISHRFPIWSYEGTLWVRSGREDGDVLAGFDKEYCNCGNGYYYLMVNDETMIGYDID